jgi:hypothetical protein
MNTNLDRLSQRIYEGLRRNKDLRSELMSKISMETTTVDLASTVRGHFQQLVSHEFPDQPLVMTDIDAVVDWEEITKALARDLT